MSNAVLHTAFDTTKVKIIKREKKYTLVEILEGVMKGQKIQALPQFIFPLKQYKLLHNKIYH